MKRDESIGSTGYTNPEGNVYYLLPGTLEQRAFENGKGPGAYHEWYCEDTSSVQVYGKCGSKLALNAEIGSVVKGLWEGLYRHSQDASRTWYVEHPVEVPDRPCGVWDRIRQRPRKKPPEENPPYFSHLILPSVDYLFFSDSESESSGSSGTDTESGWPDTPEEMSHSVKVAWSSLIHKRRRHFARTRKSAKSRGGFDRCAKKLARRARQRRNRLAHLDEPFLQGVFPGRALDHLEAARCLEAAGMDEKKLQGWTNPYLEAVRAQARAVADTEPSVVENHDQNYVVGSRVHIEQSTATSNEQIDSQPGWPGAPEEMPHSANGHPPDLNAKEYSHNVKGDGPLDVSIDGLYLINTRGSNWKSTGARIPGSYADFREQILSNGCGAGVLLKYTAGIFRDIAVASEGDYAEMLLCSGTAVVSEIQPQIQSADDTSEEGGPYKTPNRGTKRKSGGGGAPLERSNQEECGGECGSGGGSSSPCGGGRRMGRSGSDKTISPGMVRSKNTAAFAGVSTLIDELIGVSSPGEQQGTGEMEKLKMKVAQKNKLTSRLYVESLAAAGKKPSAAFLESPVVVTLTEAIVTKKNPLQWHRPSDCRTNHPDGTCEVTNHPGGTCEVTMIVFCVVCEAHYGSFKSYTKHSNDYRHVAALDKHLGVTLGELSEAGVRNTVIGQCAAEFGTRVCHDTDAGSLACNHGACTVVFYSETKNAARGKGSNQLQRNVRLHLEKHDREGKNTADIRAFLPSQPSACEDAVRQLSTTQSRNGPK